MNFNNQFSLFWFCCVSNTWSQIQLDHKAIPEAILLQTSRCVINTNKITVILSISVQVHILWPGRVKHALATRRHWPILIRKIRSKYNHHHNARRRPDTKHTEVKSIRKNTAECKIIYDFVTLSPINDYKNDCVDRSALSKFWLDKIFFILKMPQHDFARPRRSFWKMSSTNEMHSQYSKDI